MTLDAENKIILYQTPDGKTHLNVRLENDTIWLTQAHMVALFKSSKANISEHIKQIYQTQELEKEGTVRDFRTVRMEGQREVSRKLVYYNLDMIIAIAHPPGLWYISNCVFYRLKKHPFLSR